MGSAVREISAKGTLGSGLGRKLKDLVAFRELLVNLVRKELKVRYKNSALGFLWSMVNPLLYLVVFFVVFNVFLPGGIPQYHVYLLAGLLPWTLFSNSLVQATGSIIGNSDLVKKVYFPREMLPLSAIGAGLFHFFLQLLVLVAFLVVTGYRFTGRGVLLVPAALVAELLLLGGLGLLTSSVNVKARDIQYIIELALLAWFWMTPVVYPSAMVAERMAERSVAGVSMISIYLANPMARVVLAFQRGIYGAGRSTEGQEVLIDAPIGWFLEGIGYVAVLGLVLCLVGWWLFYRLEGRFAEEL